MESAAEAEVTRWKLHRSNHFSVKNLFSLYFGCGSCHVLFCLLSGVSRQTLLVLLLFLGYRGIMMSSLVICSCLMDYCWHVVLQNIVTRRQTSYCELLVWSHIDILFFTQMCLVALNELEGPLRLHFSGLSSCFCCACCAVGRGLRLHLQLLFCEQSELEFGASLGRDRSLFFERCLRVQKSQEPRHMTDTLPI